MGPSRKPVTYDDQSATLATSPVGPPPAATLHGRSVAHDLSVDWSDGRNWWAAHRSSANGSQQCGRRLVERGRPNDMAAHKSVPRYVPQQDFQNAIQQDTLADWLGPMQKPAPKQPAPTSAY